MITLIGDDLVVLCAVLAVCCVVAYQVSTGGKWRTSEYSRHMMAFTASIAGILILGSVRIVAVDVFGSVDPTWLQWLRVAVFATLPVVLAWRLWLILTTQSVEVTVNSVPIFVQHLLLMLAATVAAWTGTDLVPVLNGQPGWGALAGTLVAALLGYVVPFINSYGVGSGKHVAAMDGAGVGA